MPNSENSPKIADVISKLPNAAEITKELETATALDGSPLVYVSQLGSDLDEAKGVLTAYVHDTVAREAILDAYKQLPRSTTPSPTPTLAPAPTSKQFSSTDPAPHVGISLSGGSQPRLNDVQGEVQMMLPSILSASASPGKPVQLSSLSWTDWVQIADNCNLTFALNVSLLGKRTKAPFGEERAFRWRADKSATAAAKVQIDDFPGGLSYQVSYTNAQHDAFDANVIAAELDFNWFAAVSAKARLSSSFATAVRERHFWVTYKDVHPACRLILRECLEPSEALTDKLQQAMFDGDLADTANRKAKPVLGANGAFSALTSVFDHFGHVVASEVYLGAYFRFAIDRTITDLSSDKQSEMEAALKVGMENIAKDPAVPSKASGATTVSIGAKDWLANDCLREGLSKGPVGGNTDAREIADWLPTAGEPALWAVIGRTQFLPITDFVDGELGELVKTVWKDGRRCAWETLPSSIKRRTMTVPLNDALYPVPAFWDAAGGVSGVTLVNVKGLTVLQASNGVRAPDPKYDVIPAQMDPSTGRVGISEQRFPITPKDQPDATSESGSMWCESVAAPLRLPSSATANPKLQNALWTFVYTGECSGDMPGKVPSSPLNRDLNSGHPYYWLMTQDESALLSGYKDTETGEVWASLLPVRHATDRDPGQSPAAWMLLPADPSSRLTIPGVDSSTLYLLWNPLLGAFLGCEKNYTGKQRWVEAAHDYQEYAPLPMYPGQPVQYSIKTKHKEEVVTENDSSFSRTELFKLSVVEAYALSQEKLVPLCWSITIPAALKGN